MMTSCTGRGVTQAIADAELQDKLSALYAKYLALEPIADAWELVRREHDISFGEGGDLIHAITQWVRV